MPDLDLEREHLAKAEPDIAEGRVHDPTAEVEHLRLSLEATLAEWQARREDVLRDLERHNALRSG